MCGICGIIKSDNGAGVDSTVLQNMRESMMHRGPDDAGLWISKNKSVGLAHRRLSIIDLSEAGQQPMSNTDGKIRIVFNGEIYNFLEIRQLLKARKHQFRSQTDTEVIIHAYEEWGKDCLKYFNGMFAFVLYDYRKQNDPFLFIARDRVGKKPLYYYQNADEFYFASELKGIKTVTDKKLGIDYKALNFYLALGYVPGDMCILDGVKKLPPAHAGFFDIKKNELKTWRYWEVPFPEDDNEKYSAEELTDELEYFLKDSVRLRMTSDVPLGIFLSGGVDSSLITAIAAKQTTTPVKTFTIAFPDAGKYDESQYAKIIADYFKTDHHVLNGKESISDTIKQILPFIDEPIADSSLLPTYLVSKLTRRHVTVALGGDGGDELFGGYTHYRDALRDKKRLANIPVAILKAMASLAAKLPAGVKGRNRIAALRGGYLEKSIWGNPYFDIDLRKRLLKPDVLDALGKDIDAPEQFMYNLLIKGKNDIDKLTRLDFATYLPEDIMTKVDRAGMANSLEVRAPWLDYRIIEFAFKKVPARLKANSTNTRILQKRLAARLLPKELNLERKQGFSAPMDTWMRGDEGQQWFKAWSAQDKGLFNRSFIESLMNGELKGRMNGARLWAVGTLGLLV